MTLLDGDASTKSFDQLHIETVRELEVYATNWLFNNRKQQQTNDDDSCSDDRDQSKIDQFSDFLSMRMQQEVTEVTTNIHEELEAFGKCGTQVQSMVARINEFQTVILFFFIFDDTDMSYRHWNNCEHCMLKFLKRQVHCMMHAIN
jgi:hypothetical protein